MEAFIKQMAEISIFPKYSYMWKPRIYVRYEKTASRRNEGVGMKEEGGGKDRGRRVTLRAAVVQPLRIWEASQEPPDKDQPQQQGWETGFLLCDRTWWVGFLWSALLLALVQWHLLCSDTPSDSEGLIFWDDCWVLKHWFLLIFPYMWQVCARVYRNAHLTSF